MQLILIVLLVALLIPLIAVILDSQVGRALAARLEGRGGTDSPSERRLAALEAELDRITRELQRLDDESAFVRRLLEERPEERSLPPGDDER
jgi:hypothetical protein